MYQIAYTSKFKKDYKLAIKRGYKEAHIQHVITSIARKIPLAAKYKSHKLTGEYENCMECHISPDWLLIWQIDEQDNILILLRTGTHSDLF
jgi:mRNA interferase YafQ